MQLELDFRLYFREEAKHLMTELPKWTPGIIAAARLSRKTDLVELLREYDSQQHPTAELTARDYTYAILALLHLLPSSITRKKAKLSSTELRSSLIVFKPEQIALDVFVSDKAKGNNKQPSLLSLGSKDEPGTFYLILDSKAVSLGDCGTLRAIDCLFKTHFVYWVSYAKSLALFMEFLQKVVYRIEPTKFSPRVRELHSSILALTSNSSRTDLADTEQS